MTGRHRMRSLLLTFAMLSAAGFDMPGWAKNADEAVDQTALAIPRIGMPGARSVALPQPLSPGDVARIRRIFALQRVGSITDATREMEGLESDILRGTSSPTGISIPHTFLSLRNWPPGSISTANSRMRPRFAPCWRQSNRSGNRSPWRPLPNPKRNVVLEPTPAYRHALSWCKTRTRRQSRPRWRFLPAGRPNLRRPIPFSPVAWRPGASTTWLPPDPCSRPSGMPPTPRRCERQPRSGHRAWRRMSATAAAGFFGCGEQRRKPGHSTARSLVMLWPRCCPACRRMTVNRPVVTNADVEALMATGAGREASLCSRSANRRGRKPRCALYGSTQDGSRYWAVH
jgi:hypothetical protein